MKHYTIDFETRSAIDIKKCGAYIYSIHKSTEVLCMAYRGFLDDSTNIWHREHAQHFIAESPAPMDLFEHVAAGGLVEAHNVGFEIWIWRNIMMPKYGWPDIPDNQWRCSASRASACSLPRDLAGAGMAMNLDVQKDDQGRRLMLKMSKPRKPVKADITNWMAEKGLTGDYRKYANDFTDDVGLMWHEDEADLYRLWEYCIRDVDTEFALSKVLPELSAHELKIWQADQVLNRKGLKFDLRLARAALNMADKYKEILNKELYEITGIPSAGQRQQVRDWLLYSENVDIPDTTGETLEHHITDKSLSETARRVMQIVLDANRTSTRKYSAMLVQADPNDWCIRDLLLYHGAGTGRWAGKGVQVQNFPARNLIIKNIDDAVDDVLSGDVDWCIAIYGDIMKLLSHVLRGAIIARAGKRFMVADYSAIEARGLFFLSDSFDALDVFRRGDDIYCDMAEAIYGFPVNKKDHPDERFTGKQAVLGLGYQMGYITFLLTCHKFGISFTREQAQNIMGKIKLEKLENWVEDQLFPVLPENATPADKKKFNNKRRQAAKHIRRIEDVRLNPRQQIHSLALMKHIVDAYRGKYEDVKTYWDELEECAIAAVKNPGQHFPVRGKVTYFVEDDFLCCELPSKRLIRYKSPEVKPTKTAWGSVKDGLRYMSVNGVTRKWERTATYGGKLCENVVQAFARDIMAEALLNAHNHPDLQPLALIHDEMVAEVDEESDISVQEFEALMCDLPAWANGCPVTAEGETYLRYRK